ncbi:MULTISPECIES: hypothetical protein [Paenarthrobacter]|uniref:hypothetical protein n=1 Tax=Paenarthrobacter TaxID=1742992 RepID=UPI0013E3B9A3|nr:hypothetical protein [Paenarthrobacter ureafaciens]
MPLTALSLLLLTGCVVPSPQPSESPTPSGFTQGETTTPPASSPSSVPPPDGDGSDDGPGEDTPGRYAYRCTSLDSSPEVQLSSLAEVWAATNYTRMDSCEVTYQGPQPFQPTEREAEAIQVASRDVAAEDEVNVMLRVLGLCTRVSDEAGPDGFAGASRESLKAAADFCPDAPQGKIIAAWAEGTRVGDGSHRVGEGLQSGTYQVVKPGPSSGECEWSVRTDAGALTASGGSTDAAQGVRVEDGQNFTSDKCGIWGKM